jgi:formimidoylglutamate deiminase
MAGLTETQGDAEDSFWTWREWMYRFAAVLSPEDVHAIARQLYAEMLEAGYTSVCEFHYLHHAPDGQPYAPTTAMADAVIEAAREAGIRLTLLPVLYQRGGFDGRPLGEAQARFGHVLDDYLALLQALRQRENPMLRVGVAFHSLRAVSLQAMQRVLDALHGQDFPIHLHIAEQVAEVEDCLAIHGRRPVQLLLDEMPVDARWTLVHATHLDAAEVQGIAASGATVALCPTTEANLGDGLFPLRAYLQAGGRWGIGSDSHVSVSPIEELRWLEYGQRLIERRRNRAALQPGSTGEALLAGIAASAAAASGFALGELVAGQCADVIALDARAVTLAGATAADLAGRLLFAGNQPLIESVWVAGQRVVEGGRHRHRDAFRSRYVTVLEKLLAAA